MHSLESDDYIDSGNLDDFFRTPQVLRPASRRLWEGVMRQCQNRGEGAPLDFLTPPPFDSDSEPDEITPDVPPRRRRTRRVWLHT